MDRFDSFVGRFRRKALRSGISARTLEIGFHNVRFNKTVIEHDQNQPENSRAIWDYLEQALKPERVATGRKIFLKNDARLQRIEKRFGIRREVLIAIWGLESAFGTLLGDFAVIESLATLACDGRRRLFFENQLIAAFSIIQSGAMKPNQMRGSWAGAIGHTQFMPSNILQHAVDFDGDKKCNLVADDPSDALATSAAFLVHSGWSRGQPIVALVNPGPDSNLEISGLDIKKSISDWLKLGVRLVDATNFPPTSIASLLLPAGENGPAFLVSHNFRAVLRYNNSVSYGLAVALLAEQIGGCGPVLLDWPKTEQPVSRSEMHDLQTMLTCAGFDTFGTDGISGPNTIRALRSWQKSVGIQADGYPSHKILEALKNRSG